MKQTPVFSAERERERDAKCKPFLKKLDLSQISQQAPHSLNSDRAESSHGSVKQVRKSSDRSVDYHPESLIERTSQLI